MKGFIPVEIPTKKYIKGFIHTQLGNKPRMSRDNVIGDKLCDLLQHKTNEERTRFSTRYNCTIRLYISGYIFKHRGSFLNETNVKNFNSFVEALIKDRFYFLMDFYMEIFPSFEANLTQVRKNLGIDDDHWYDDSMKKDYYRYRIQTGKPLLYKKMFAASVPSIPFANNAF